MNISLQKQLMIWQKQGRGIVLTAYKRVKKDLTQKSVLAFFLFVVSFMLGAWLGFRAGIMGLFFFFCLAFEWENRLIGALALASLITCPFLLMLKQDVAAEVMAEYAYHFMVITVILQLVEYKRHPERFADDTQV
jgi:hypothetical protein